VATCPSAGVQRDAACGTVVARRAPLRAIPVGSGASPTRPGSTRVQHRAAAAASPEGDEIVRPHRVPVSGGPGCSESRSPTPDGSTARGCFRKAAEPVARSSGLVRSRPPRAAQVGRLGDWDELAMLPEGIHCPGRACGVSVQRPDRRRCALPVAPSARRRHSWRRGRRWENGGRRAGAAGSVSRLIGLPAGPSGGFQSGRARCRVSDAWRAERRPVSARFYSRVGCRVRCKEAVGAGCVVIRHLWVQRAA
jgi:hypothetical protein